MFCDKDSMLEMFELSSSKKQWARVLISSELFGDPGRITTSQVRDMNKWWLHAVRDLLSEEDAAYVVNQGNIFALIHTKNIEAFKRHLAYVLIKNKDDSCGVKSSLEDLSFDETAFLLQIS
ncbi:hypothetical protein IMZ31_19495 (plasmid) [Pontibacillus sp. ALD_SL1]|uniref:hypothetical protein n=1 Tax=Pontibacillus sp. ALD_SL1 TaxID=2777185 RepID=UPI001A978F88|nr:hypothetical protein [Pontibacillus sp. ALD_SL1]QST02736.1 hypothetical protein IMZ31_19495 [Pontibacillus sp. ALD_SL1]